MTFKNNDSFEGRDRQLSLVSQPIIMTFRADIIVLLVTT